MATFGYFLAGVVTRITLNVVEQFLSETVRNAIYFVLPYLGIVLFANALRTSTAMWTNRDPHQWVVFFYVVYQILWLIWIRL